MRRLLAVAALVAMRAFAEQPGDYAAGVPLQTEGTDALYQLDIPQAVYEGVARADLGDVRVFNASGEVVPHAFRPRQSETKTQTHRLPVRLPLFPIRGEETDTGVEGVAVRVDRSGGRTTIDLKSREGKPLRQTRLLGWLADASAFDEPIRAIAFELPPAGEDIFVKVRIEASDDLSAWQVVARDAQLARLTAAGQRLEQSRVELPPRKAKYLRISSPGRPFPFQPHGVAVELGEGTVTVDATREWKLVPGTPVKDRPGEYEFDFGGRFPLDRLRFALPQQNTVASLQIYSRATLAGSTPRRKGESEWRYVTNAVAYRLHRGEQEMTNADIVVGVNTDRYWLVRVDQRGGGLGAGQLLLNVGWVPHGLVFVARGEGPFQLVYGKRDAKPTAYALETLIPGYKKDAPLQMKSARVGSRGDPVQISRAVTGVPQALAGEAATREAINWRRWALWTCLALGVLMLAWMALRLGRQMAQASNAGRSGPTHSE
jgi:Protein of unknown function (DUF3999)